MTQEILLKNCTVYDPMNRIEGEVTDICVRDGKIVESVSTDAQVIDVRRRAVLPGGVDIHSHIIGSKINSARSMCPEDHRRAVVPKTPTTRSGVGEAVPSSFVIGQLYTAMGYTTVVDPAVPPMKALACWEEIPDVPVIDILMLPLFSNNMITYHYIEGQDMEGLRGYIDWLLRATGGFGVKVVNPGGTYAWAHNLNAEHLDQTIPEWDLTPNQILTSLVRAVEELRLPHPVHLHPNNLGRVGNIETTIAQLEAVRRARRTSKRKHILHLTHISFDSIASVDEGSTRWEDVASGGLELAEYTNQHDHFTVDLGQITFGPAMTMTADGPFQYLLHRVSHTKWMNITVDVELPGGAGVVPYSYSPKSLANSVQWMIALEYALNIDDPWRCVITTDSPNAGPFVRYPLVISWLMSRRERETWLETLNSRSLSRSTLSGAEREWSLYEIAIATRAAPARILGIDERKGHLGAGADADIAVLDHMPSDSSLSDHPEEIVRVFHSTYLTMKAGTVVHRNDVVNPSGVRRRVFSVQPTLPEATRKRIHNEVGQLIDRWYVHSHTNYPVPRRYRQALESPIPLRPAT